MRTGFKVRVATRRLTSWLCVGLMMQMQLLLGGCGTTADLASQMSGKTIIPLSADHPVSVALRDTAFAEPKALEIDFAARSFRLIYDDPTLSLGGSFDGTGVKATTRKQVPDATEEFTIIGLTAVNGENSAEFTLDLSKRIVGIDTSVGFQWQLPQADGDASALAAGQSLPAGANAYSAANANLLQYAREYDEWVRERHSQDSPSAPAPLPTTPASAPPVIVPASGSAPGTAGSGPPALPYVPGAQMASLNPMVVVLAFALQWVFRAVFAAAMMSAINEILAQINGLANQHGGGGGGGDELVASAVIGPAGGTVEVTDPASALYGTKVVVPPDALDADTTITIGIVSEEPDLPDGLEGQGSPAVLGPAELETDLYFDVTIPYDPDNGGVVGVYDPESGSWDIGSVIAFDAASGLATVRTTHFSWYWWINWFVSAPDKIPTNFDMATDVFPVDNLFSECFASPKHGAHCSGITAYSLWYRRHVGSGLISAYSEATAKKVACDAHSAATSPSWLACLADLVNMWASFGEGEMSRRSAEGLLTAMHLTGRPQGLLMAWFDLDVDLWPVDIDFGTGLHAVVVYKWEEPHFYIYDNNFPSDNTITIRHELVQGMEGYYQPGYQETYSWFYHLGTYAATPLRTVYESYAVCPNGVCDTDGDGVPDDTDNCPNTPAGAAVDANGCIVVTDSDGDGVPDNQDNCPNTPAGATVDANGCTAVTDSDGDGVPDDQDNCPNTPAGATVDANGCAVVTDSDGDGVPDDQDNCPNTANADQADSDGDGTGDACEATMSDGTMEGIGGWDVSATIDVEPNHGGQGTSVNIVITFSRGAQLLERIEGWTALPSTDCQPTNRETYFDPARETETRWVGTAILTGNSGFVRFIAIGAQDEQIALGDIEINGGCTMP